MELKGREKQIVNERIKKLNDLKEMGNNPYSHRFDGHKSKIHASNLLKKYSKLKKEEQSKSIEIIAGRIMSKRSFGKLAFCQMQDLSGDIQLVFQKGETSEKAMNIFKKMDSGDIVGIRGFPIKTKTGIVSILVKDFEILTKSIYPLPDKHSGLKNEDERFRKRYLDIIMNPESRKIFIKKQKFWATIRNFLIEREFLEIETPILENSAGGAAATPFITHHNALDLDVYLRISMGELWQKKALIAGFEKTFEIGRQFRNEGMDSEHLQDYTQMEFYWGYADYKDGMKLVEEMYKKIAIETLGSLKFEAHGHKINLGDKWIRYDFETLILEKTGIKIYKTKKDEIIKKLKEIKMEFNPTDDKWRLIDLLWKYCRKQIPGPGFLIGQPVEMTPLAKRIEKDNKKVEQFQIILGGSEMGNGYSELNDPIDQENRFKEQMILGKAGDSEAMEHDESYIEALKYAMPPACGFGVSERLFSFMMNKPIRECVMFPLMRPENEVIKEKKKKYFSNKNFNKQI